MKNEETKCQDASELVSAFFILHSSFEMNLAPASLGLIAGNRTLPLEFARLARAAGVKKLVAVAFENETDPALAPLVDEIVWLKVGQLSKMIAAFTGRGVTQCVMAGQIAPKNLFDFRPDLRTMALLLRLKEKNAHTIFGAIWPTMTHCVTPRSVKAAIILESWPTLSQTISSTSGSSAGSVSFLNATATSFFTPAARACRANSSGSVRLPAMMPRDAGAVCICGGRMKNEE